MSGRSTRSRKADSTAAAGKKAQTASAKRGSRYFSQTTTRKGGNRAEPDDDEHEEITEANGEDGEDGEDADYGASDIDSLHSDALDDESDVLESSAERSGKKRKRVSAASPKKGGSKAGAKGPGKASKGSPRKKRKPAKDSEEEESDLELQEGQEIVGVVVQAPKTGRVPPGQISKNTLDFLSQLKKPECNDREWFVGVHFSLTPNQQPVYRLAESEWKAFVEHFTDILVETDPQIPHLPPKDVIHRIYRDVRFSNDKTPYKKGFSASFSRSGRKGIFAAFKPGGESIIAAGSWCPGKNELATIRSNLQRSSRRLRQIISAPEFEALFGSAHPHPKGARQNIFGMEDELKVAPKGVDKTHKDIDLLKCRSFAVVYRFTDKQVLSPEFKNELAHVATVMRPFVHCLNDLMTIQGGGNDSSSSDEDQDEEAGEEDDDE
ncbi:hypothetical protein C8Q80DRAFT_1147298 [Daedaleopsis nitida]|nr:hypothetical protein C8Q80DRAFT_1147298 [Daedaleopsis nitida]